MRWQIRIVLINSVSVVFLSVESSVTRKMIAVITIPISMPIASIGDWSICDMKSIITSLCVTHVRYALSRIFSMEIKDRMRKSLIEGTKRYAGSIWKELSESAENMYGVKLIL